MKDPSILEAEEFSFLSLSVVLLRNRATVLRWTVLGVLLTAPVVISKPAKYKASAAFVSAQGADPTRSGLASIAGQFGVAIPGGAQSPSPEFYLRLIKSREILKLVARDTLLVPELAGRRISFTELFEISGATSAEREERAMAQISTDLTASVSKSTGVVDVSVDTKWPSVSLRIVETIVRGINTYNQRARQEQAAAERRFVEGRLRLAGISLREAEDRMQLFLQSNRQFSSSPQLTFEHERIQRTVLQQQQMYNSLAQSYEEFRMREVRDIPVVTLIEPPGVLYAASPRGRISVMLLGMLLGMITGAVLAVLRNTIARTGRAPDGHLLELVRLLTDVKAEVQHPSRLVRLLIP